MKSCLQYSLFFIIFLGKTAWGQSEKFPMYKSPLSIPLHVAGVFGEPRLRHFHLGVDLKTQQREGLPVKAVADGFISRISVNEKSYGKVIYVSHPEGYTSVYGHLKKFAPQIEALVKAEQYKKKSYAVNLMPPADSLKVTKQDLLAFSGNTGASSAPHLHFEIRETKTESPMNPLLFGINVADKQKPILRKLFGYPLDENSQINGSAKSTQIYFTRESDSVFIANPVKALGNIGFGFLCYDKQDNRSYNKNGFFSVSVDVNGSKALFYDFKKISFDEVPYVYTHIDYERYITTNQIIQKCFVEPENKLNIYDLSGNGIIPVEEGLSYTVKIVVSDFAGNRITLIVPVEGLKLNPTKKPDSLAGVLVTPDKDYLFRKDSVDVYFPPNTFFRDLKVDIHRSGSVLSVHKDTAPIKNKYRMSFDISGYSDALKDALFVAKKAKDALIYQYSKRYNDKLNAWSDSLGDFKIVLDTVPPTLVPKNFSLRDSLGNKKKLVLKTFDTSSGIASYVGTINGKWALFEYEYKDGELTCDLSDFPPDMKVLDLAVSVTDRVGNATHFSTTLYR